MDDAQIADEYDHNEITDSDEIPCDTVYKDRILIKENTENKLNKDDNQNMTNNDNNDKFDSSKLPEKITRASKRFDNGNENENDNKSQSINNSQRPSVSEEPSSYKNEHIVSVKKINYNKYKQELRSQYRDSKNGLYPQDNYSERKKNYSHYENGNGNRTNLFYSKKNYVKNNYEDEYIPRYMFFPKDGHYSPDEKYQYDYEDKYEKEDEIIPRIMFFQRGNEYLVPNKNMSRNNNIRVKNGNNSESEKVPMEGFSKYTMKKNLYIGPQRGMDNGEYIFEGGKMKLEERDISEEKVKIDQEEIYKEINRRRKEQNSKEKKLNYKVIDKFYITTEFGRESLFSNSEENPDKEKNTNQNHIDFFKNSNDNDTSFPTDNYSKYIFTQINKIRTDPQSIIGIIEDAKDNIIEDKYGRIIYNRDLKIALTKGQYAFDDTIEFLQKQKPMKALEFKPIITITPPSKERDIEDKTYLRKEVRKMMKNGIRIKSYWRDVIRDPEISFMLMIADDNGAKSGKRRNDILDPNMKYIGISSVEINDSFACYIVLSTGD